MSATFAPYTIIAALQKLLNIGNATTGWKPHGIGEAQQQAFLEEFYSKGIPKGGFSPDELETIGSLDVGVVNSFLKEKGFDIQLQQSQDPRALYTASVMNVLVKWLEPGTESQVLYQDQRYPAANMSAGFVPYRSGGKDVLKFYTETKDTVWITPSTPREGFDLIRHAQKVMGNLGPNPGGQWGRYSKAVFPMVSLDRMEDISYFIGMVFLGVDMMGEKTPFIIEQALNQNKLKMNHLGARAESAAAFGAMRGMSSSLVIDEPFMVWFTREGLDLPFFVAYVTPDDWKNPGVL